MTGILEKFPTLLQNGYGFGFYRTPAKPKYVDNRVLQTMEELIKDFFLTGRIDTVALYHCQTNEANTAQAARERMFSNLYDSSPSNKLISKNSLEVNMSINDELITHYVGFMSRRDNPDIDKACVEMEEFAIYMAQDNIDK